MAQASPVGIGITYPVAFADVSKTQLLELAQGNDVIHQSIYTILSTSIGERYNNPRFGSNLYSLVFEPNTNLLKDLLYFYTVEALAKWEPRISVNQVGFVLLQDDDHFIGININYTIRSTNTAGNYVFPFVRGGESMASLLSK